MDLNYLFHNNIIYTCMQCSFCDLGRIGLNKLYLILQCLTACTVYSTLVLNIDNYLFCLSFYRMLVSKYENPVQNSLQV